MSIKKIAQMTEVDISRNDSFFMNSSRLLKTKIRKSMACKDTSPVLN